MIKVEYELIVCFKNIIVMVLVRVWVLKFLIEKYCIRSVSYLVYKGKDRFYLNFVYWCFMFVVIWMELSLC